MTYEKNLYVYINSGAANTVMTSASQEDFPPPTNMLPHPLDNPGGSTRMQDPHDPFGLNHGLRSSSQISGAGIGGTKWKTRGGSGSNAYSSHSVAIDLIQLSPTLHCNVQHERSFGPRPRARPTIRLSARP